MPDKDPDLDDSVEEREETTPEDPKVEVKEDKPEETVQVSTKPKPKEKKESTVSYEDFKKERKRSEFLNRKLEKTLSRLDSVLNQPKEPEKPEPANVPEEKPDDLDRIAEQDWKKAVGILGRREAEKLLREQQEQQQAQLNYQNKIKELESSKKRVRERYPQIEDDSSAEYAMYNSVLEEDPNLLSNLQGPEIAMYRMEEKMRQQGKKPAPFLNEFNTEVDQEVQRRMRVGAGSLPQGTARSGDTVQLTQSEINTAKQLGIPLSEYAKFYKMGSQSFKEGVSVDEDEA